MSDTMSDPFGGVGLDSTQTPQMSPDQLAAAIAAAHQQQDLNTADNSFDGSQSDPQTAAMMQQRQQQQDNTVTSYAGDRDVTDLHAVRNKDGSSAGFWKQPAFWDGLLNFGAGTLAANTPGSNPFAAIGHGIQNAVENNRAEREIQADIHSHNAANAQAQAQTQMTQAEAGFQNMKTGLAQRYYGQMLNGGSADNTVAGQPDTIASAAQNTQQADDAQVAGIPESPLKLGIKQTESSNDYNKVNQYGYTGAYQFGTAALEHAGMYKPADGESLKSNQWKGQITVPGYAPMTQQQFLQSPDAQEVAMHQQLHTLADDLHSSGATNYIGKTVNGVPITEASLLAAAHTAGVGKLNDWLQGKANNYADGNGTSIPAYISSVAQNSIDPSVVSPNSRAYQQQHLYSVKALTNLHSNAAWNNQSQVSTDQAQQLAQMHYKNATMLGFIGDNASAATERAQGDKWQDFALAGPKAAAEANAQVAPHNAEAQYKLQHTPIGLRESVAIPQYDTQGNLTGVSYQRQPEFKPVQLPGDPREHIVSLEQNAPNAPITSQNVLTIGPTELSTAQSKGIIDTTKRDMEESADAAEKAVPMVDTMNNLQQQLLQMPTNPGVETLNTLRHAVGNFYTLTGQEMPAQLQTQLNSASNIANMSSAMKAWAVSGAKGIRTQSEFNTVAKAAPELNTPEGTAHFAVATKLGDGLDDLSLNAFKQSMRAGARTNGFGDENGVYNSQAAAKAYYDKVPSTTYTYRALLNAAQYDNNPNSGLNKLCTQLFGQPGSKQTLPQQVRWKNYMKSIDWLRQNDILRDANGQLDPSNASEQAQQQQLNQANGVTQ